MIARFSGDRKHAQLISIPRDSWVDIPGHGKNKINASYAFGGPTLLIQTVEQLTQVRIDHYVAIDFDGLIQVTDDLGGVDVVVAETSSNGPVHVPRRAQPPQRGAGPLVPGPAARPARRRLRPRAPPAAVPAGDVQQLFSSNTFTDPGRLDSALLAVTTRSPWTTAWATPTCWRSPTRCADVTPQNVQFFTAPVLGTGMEGAASVVYLNRSPATGCGATCAPTPSQNAGEFAEQALPERPR